MPIDWNAVEEAAVRGALHDFAKFSQEHRDEEFYGVIFWCEAPEIFTFMPTEELLRDESERIHQKYYKHHAGKSVEDIMAEGRWGATQYPVSDYITWDDYEDQISSLTEEEQVNDGFDDMFFDMLCRVALRIEASNAFEAFRRTPSFRIVCIASDEDFATCQRKFSQIREAFDS